MDAEEQRESLKDEMLITLEEARMVLPGVQALFGFQLIAVFNATFGTLSGVLQRVHLFSIALVAVTIALIMAPAAVHRIAQRGRLSQRLIDITSDFLTASMATLMIALAVDFGLVAFLILRDTLAGVALGSALFAVLLVCWVVVPLRYRRKR